MKIHIQPPSPKTDPLKVPYPYWINDKGEVEMQYFWHGNPARLIGWTKPRQQSIEVNWTELFSGDEAAKDKLQKVQKLHPVFVDKTGDWFTLTVKCEVKIFKDNEK